jgi:ferredoxin
LQEEGGIHNSHAEILLAREKAKWKEAAAKEADALAAAGGTAATGPAAVAPLASEATAPAAAAAPEPAAPERNPDEAWIETARCPSCNECQNINDKMFRYNENKQAYIADVKLGTYRQLVEAAEVCQVAIIHPGKPWDTSEPGLDDLVARAQAFA